MSWQWLVVRGPSLVVVHDLWFLIPGTYFLFLIQFDRFLKGPLHIGQPGDLRNDLDVADGPLFIHQHDGAGQKHGLIDQEPGGFAEFSLL